MCVLWLLGSAAISVVDLVKPEIPEVEGQTVTVRGKRGDYGVDAAPRAGP